VLQRFDHVGALHPALKVALVEMARQGQGWGGVNPRRSLVTRRTIGRWPRGGQVRRSCSRNE
jgi:hypothetical protein